MTEKDPYKPKERFEITVGKPVPQRLKIDTGHRARLLRSWRRKASDPVEPPDAPAVRIVAAAVEPPAVVLDYPHGPEALGAERRGP